MIGDAVALRTMTPDEPEVECHHCNEKATVEVMDYKCEGCGEKVHLCKSHLKENEEYNAFNMALDIAIAHMSGKQEHADKLRIQAALSGVLVELQLPNGGAPEGVTKH